MTAQQLKNSILQMAVQGKLVPQNPDDEPASVLLERIKAEKEELIKQKKIKKEKPSAPITEDEIPFEIPENWEWCKVKDLFSNMSGLSYKKDTLSIKSEKMIRVMRGGNIFDGNYKLKDDDVFISSDFVKADLLLKRNYMITPSVTSMEHIGKIALIDRDYDNIVVGGFVLMLIPHCSDDILSKYLLYAFSSKYHRDICRSITHKSGQAFYNLSREKLMEILVPIPPLAEQQRIVSKIEELLPYIEAYEKAETQLTALNTSFPDMLKKSILQEAVQGKLVPQNPDDEPASVLLERIRAEKQELIKQGKIKKEKPSAPISEDEIPFEIPESWEWVRLGNIFKIGTGMTPLKSESLFYMNGNIPWVTSSLTNQKFIEKADTYITEYALNNTTLELYPADTLIIAMYGQGKTRGQISILNIPATINQACAALSPICNYNGLNDYIYYFFV